MKKIALLMPLMLFSIFENNECMHRKSMKKMYKQQNYRPRKVHYPKKRKKRFVQQKEVRKKKKAGFVDSLDNLCALKKSSPVKSFASNGDFYLANKGFILNILIFYFAFLVILRK